MAKISIRRILGENWRQYLEGNKAEPYQRKEVGKMLDCGKSSSNSRLCAGCGKRHADNWAKNVAKSLLPLPHVHAVLTIPASLRHLLRDWERLRAFMDASSSFSGVISL